MFRKLSVAVVALAMAGGVYLGTGTAQASNMGFKLERDFAFVTGFRNFYYLSFPLFNGLGDIAGATGADRCAAAPDGVVDTNDAICDLFTDRATCTNCSFAITKLDTTICQVVTVKADKRPPPIGLAFQGVAWTMTVDPNRDLGYFINVANAPASPLPTNRAVVVGSYDPAWTGHRVSAASCLRDIVAIPYHTMYRKAAEVMCGLENTDWVDNVNNLSGAAPGDGQPDTCPNGIFDPVSNRRTAITVFDNEPGNNEFPNTDNQNITYTANVVAGRLTFAGNNMSLVPGNAYLINLLAGYNNRTFLPPHF